jgi:hypothetical protein
LLWKNNDILDGKRLALLVKQKKESITSDDVGGYIAQKAKYEIFSNFYFFDSTIHVCRIIKEDGC